MPTTYCLLRSQKERLKLSEFQVIAEAILGRDTDISILFELLTDKQEGVGIQELTRLDRSTERLCIRAEQVVEAAQAKSPYVQCKLFSPSASGIIQ
jgi:hypothetical protein